MSLKAQLSRVLFQKAAYWSPNGEDQFNEKQFLPAVVVKCRWEDKAEEIVTPTGVRIISNSRIYVGSDTVVGGFVFLLYGGLRPPSSMTDEQLLQAVVNRIDPLQVEGAREIYKFDKMPDRRVTEFFRVAYL